MSRHIVKFDKTWVTKPEINSGERLVETAGYVTTRTLVDQMMLGGLQRGMAKNVMYDLSRGMDVTDADYDPAKIALRSYGFDYFQAVNLRDAVKARLSARLRKAQKAKEDNVPPAPPPPPPEEPPLANGEG